MALKRINGDLSAWKRALPRDTSGIDSTHPKYSYAYRMGKNGREDFGTYYHESQYGEFEENKPFENGRLRAQNEINNKLMNLGIKVRNDKSTAEYWDDVLNFGVKISILESLRLSSHVDEYAKSDFKDLPSDVQSKLKQKLG
jgi:hypothetical protein